MTSTWTQKYKFRARIFWLLSFIATICPMLIFLVRAFIVGEAHQKLVLGILCIAAIILTVVNVLLKMNIRSTIWLLLLGIYMVIEYIMPLLLCVAIGTIIDEFVFTPLYKKYKRQYQTHKEIDKR